jgi:hypothetical protein
LSHYFAAIVWVELSYFYVSHRKHFMAQLRIVGFVKHYTHDACLDNLASAKLAGKTCGVNRSAQGSGTTCFQNSRFLSVKAKALIKFNALSHIVIASAASTLIAVGQARWCPIVASTNHSAIFSDDSSISSLHAVRPRSSQFG